MLLPQPTNDEVNAAIAEFDSDSWTRLGEDALAQLRSAFPNNTDAAQVLLKVIALDKLYSTRIQNVDVVKLAQQITALNIDAAIANGSLEVVDQIWRCDGQRHYFSFASKYCSWHNPEAYPIYDSFAEECLWQYRKRDKFHQYRRSGYNYAGLVQIVKAFQQYYGLTDVPFRQLDKFLWLWGKRILEAAKPKSAAQLAG